jgi:uncharacterized circularly permuted ATP-grasp superfamily protein
MGRRKAAGGTRRPRMAIDWEQYRVDGLYDEIIARASRPRPAARALARLLTRMDEEELSSRQAAADLSIKEMGITFTVYTGEEGSIDRTWPFDIIPRIIPKSEWYRVEAGLKQRVQALNLVIDDIYHDQRIIKDGIVPASCWPSP